MATAPIFIGTPICGVVLVSAANTARDGSGTVPTVYTPGGSGGRVDLVRVHSVGTITAGVIRIYVHNGTTNFLIKEIMVIATTPSTTVEAWSEEWRPGVPLVLPSGYSLRASTHIAENFNVFAHGGDL